MVAGFAALDVEVVAIALLFALLAGLLIIRPLLVNLANQLPVVGPALASRVDSILNAWLTALTGPAQAGLGAFTSLLAWLDTQWRQLAATTVGFAQLTTRGLWVIQNLTIPRVAAATLAQASILVREAAVYAEELRQQTQTLFRGLLGAQAAATAEAIAAERAFVLQVAATGAAETALLVGGATAQAAALVAEAENLTRAGLLAEHDYAGALYEKALAALVAASAALGAQLGGMTLQQDENLTRGISELERKIAEASKLLTEAAAVSIAVVAADVAAIRALRCIKACNVLGAMGEGLQLLDLAAIFGLVIAARTDPKAVQQFFVDEVAPAVRAISAAI